MSIHTGSHNKSRELQCIVRSRLQYDLQWWTGVDPLSYFMTLYITLYPLITTTSRWTDSISWWALSTDREEFVGCVLMFNFSWGARMSTWEANNNNNSTVIARTSDGEQFDPESLLLGGWIYSKRCTGWTNERLIEWVGFCNLELVLVLKSLRNLICSRSQCPQELPTPKTSYSHFGSTDWFTRSLLLDQDVVLLLPSHGMLAVVIGVLLL